MLECGLKDKQKISSKLIEEVLKVKVGTPLSSFCWKIAAGKTEKSLQLIFLMKFYNFSKSL